MNSNPAPDDRVIPAGPYIEHEIVATGLAFPEGPVALSDGSVLVVEIANGTLTRIEADGRREVVAAPGGGPNGAAVGPDGAIYVCNNGGFAWHREAGLLRPTTQSADYAGGRIERIELHSGRVDVLYRDCNGRRLCGPNDLVFDRHGGFYFSDNGKRREFEIDRGAVYYAKADGSAIRPVIAPIPFPNGVGLSPSEDELYVAETETGRLWAFAIRAPGEVEMLPWPSPSGGRYVFGSASYQRLDSLKVEADGRICVATLVKGGLSSVTPSGDGLEHVVLPDRQTTNLCFAGVDLRTVYATLSSTGRLARLRWPRPGLALNFNDRARA
ncbi:MAG TPA: SMP-30/gluconolactonase/LRE family protein [Burkholderiaceae bacterium]